MDNYHFEFGPKSIECLHNAGWYPNRDIPIDDILTEMEKEGYTSNERVDDFLRKFGNLKIVHPHRANPNITDYFHTFPIEAAETIYKEKVEEYEEKLNENLFIIGEAHKKHMVLLMASTGKVYGVYDDVVVLKGESGESAINNICEGVPGTVISEG